MVVRSKRQAGGHHDRTMGLVEKEKLACKDAARLDTGDILGTCARVHAVCWTLP